MDLNRIRSRISDKFGGGKPTFDGLVEVIRDEIMSAGITAAEETRYIPMAGAVFLRQEGDFPAIMMIRGNDNDQPGFVETVNDAARHKGAVAVFFQVPAISEDGRKGMWCVYSRRGVVSAKTWFYEVDLKTWKFSPPEEGDDFHFNFFTPVGAPN